MMKILDWWERILRIPNINLLFYQDIIKRFLFLRESRPIIGLNSKYLGFLGQYRTEK